jgi:hypothetical protein
LFEDHQNLKVIPSKSRPKLPWKRGEQKGFNKKSAFTRSKTCSYRHNWQFSAQFRVFEDFKKEINCKLNFFSIFLLFK